MASFIVEPTTSELDHALVAKECTVGPHCTPNKPCAGDNYYKCQTDLPRTKKVERTGIIDLGQPDRSIFHWTCVQGWECHLVTVELTPQIQLSPSFEIFTILPNGVRHVLSTHDNTYHTTREGESFVCSKVSYHHIWVGARCMNSSEWRSCVVNKTPWASQWVFAQIKHDSCEFTEGTHAIKFPCQGTSDQGTVPERFSVSNLDMGTSLQSTIEAVNQISYVHTQTMYNVLILTKALTQLSKLTNKLVRHLAYQDNTLIGGLINMPFKAKAITPTIFGITTCATIKEQKGRNSSNCIENFKWDGHKWRLRLSNDTCKTLDLDKIMKIKLQDEISIDTTFLEKLKVDQASMIDYLVSMSQDQNFVPQTNKDYTESSSYPWGLSVWTTICTFFSNLGGLLPFINFLLVMRAMRR